jgi:hypothetical protein
MARKYPQNKGTENEDFAGKRKENKLGFQVQKLT